jgi:hypothetical protein
MTIDSSFETLQKAVDASAESVKEARRRRDVFVAALSGRDDVFEVRPSGSLARSTHKDPIHDVDLVCVFHAENHTDWGQAGDSAEEALEHTRTAVKELLGTKGTDGVEVRRCDLKNHSVKCFLDDPGDPDAFTVDVTPALLHPDRGLWVPEQFSEDWIRSDPQDLIDRVQKRREDWERFPELVRVLKRWNSDHGAHMKSLVVEVLALHHMSQDTTQRALANFFTAAAVEVWNPITDPAELCGEIQPDLVQAAAAKVLESAADLAARAVNAESGGETRKAMILWNELFGDIYPGPPAVGAALPGTGGAVVAPEPKRRVVDAPQG